MTPAANGFAVELRHVTKRFGERAAVDDLSLAIPRGSVYGFIGPNGAGKTTTIRMIMDIIAPDAGDVLIGGRPRTRTATATVGYLPEERGLYQKMKIGWTLAYFARLKGLTDRKVIAERSAKWLERFGLLDRRNEKVEALSKGNQQKVQFITAILHEPELIISDEPFSGLDPVNQQLLAEIIGEERARGRTTIFSTHIMEQAEKLCDHVFMILGGKKMLDGTLADVKARFGTGRYAVELESADGAAFLATAPGVASVRTRSTGGRSVHEVALQEGASVSDLVRGLASRGDLRRLEREEPSLHDIFCEVAGRDVFVEAAKPAEVAAA